MPAGRPSVYSDDIAAEVCSRIASGESLRKICKDEHMPTISSIMLWLCDGKHSQFSEQYAEARRVQAEVLADELMEIADNGRNDFMEQSDDGGGVAYKLNGEHIQRSRLRVDTRKWYLSKVLPRFADKQQIEHSGKIDTSVSDEELDRRINDLIAIQAAKN